MTDILFAVSPTNSQDAYPPFYFLYLAGYLEKCGFSVAIADPHEKTYEGNVSRILDDVRRLQPRFVGLAAFVTDYHVIMDLGQRIRHIWEGPLLVGNAHASIAPEDFLQEGSPFTVVVRGEGELTLEEILRTWTPSGDPAGIKGIAFRGHDGIRITEPRELMSLDTCGMPAYHLLDMTWYAQPRKVIIRRLATVGAVIYIGRGCPFQCTFCAANTVWQTNARRPGCPVVRKRPMEHVIEDLRILQDRHGFDFFYILDDTFGVREQDVVEFCEAYRKSGLKMLWAAETRVKCLQREELVLLLKESGCLQLDFGVETGSQRLLDKIKKRCTVEEIERAFELCHRHGIRTFSNILLNLPSETEEDLEATHRLLGKIRPTYVSIGVTQPYPGTEIAENLPEPLSREDYCHLSRLTPPEKFRLAAHRKDLQKLLFSWQFRYGIEGPVETSFFRADLRYWRKIWGSPHRTRYLKYLLWDNLMMPLRFAKSLVRFFRSRSQGDSPAGAT